MTPVNENDSLRTCENSRERGLVEKPAQHTAAVRLHDELATDWDGKYQKRSYRERLTLLDELLRELNLKSMVWLDAGCGTGTMSRWLAARGCQVRGVDAAPSMIQIARQMSVNDIGTEGLQFEVIGNIETLPFLGSSFDGILCSSVLEYAARPERCLEEFARVMRSGGKLLISVPNAHSLIRKALRTAHDLSRLTGRAWLPYLEHSHHEYSVAEFAQHLGTHGFRAEKSVVFGTPLPRWMQRSSFLGSLIMVLASRR
jgi:2-polyprenyl-6-hydroxyphenyl methylase/3-demethylubiquinone-9 3-methyltransferase